ncbi:zinc-binding dehydrogenase [Saccharopolyspora indica]|uniref:quinone oxidoreductase family protein n=1 Tax=Saccharopolyspora indica TaxID=1229659 RepID=UPI0022EB1651|nr:zinc-binding dehydrogenase [Saccharopolyspora indica]MDA3644276.1 zinc-binding dehydrogenase [Saccharopolyspora indica]
MTTITALAVTPQHAWEKVHVEAPDPGPGQVLIRATAFALNNGDVRALDNGPGDTAEPVIGGYEVAGTITAVGAGVDSARIGSRVMATTSRAFAECAVAQSDLALPIPEGLSDAEGVTLPVALLTEYGALRAGRLSAGQTVLITGATSAIGLVGVQLAKVLGAGRVLATTRSPGKAELLTSLGVDQVVITSSEPLTEAVLAATDGIGVDLAVDHVAGQTFAEVLPATRIDGQVVQAGRLGGAASTIDVDALSFRHLTVRGVSYGRPEVLAQLLGEAYEAALPALSDGRLRPVVDQEFPFDRANDAAERVRSGATRGKVVLVLP